MVGKINVTELLNKVIRGDKKAQERLYKYYKQRIEYFLRDTYPNNNDLEDDTSEILIKIFHNIETYDSKKSKFNTWVINIAKNHMIDKSRKKKPLYTDFTTCFIDNSTSDAYSTLDSTTFNINNTLTISEPTSYYCSPDHDVTMTSSIMYVNDNVDPNNMSMMNMKSLGYNYREIGLEFNMTESQVSNKVNYLKAKMKEKGEN